MPNLSALAPLTTAATALSNLVLVSPQSTVGFQPQNPPNANGTLSTAEQPPALLFDYLGEEITTLESDITDHYVEDNTAVEDQIALKPEIISVHGFVGELNDVVPPALKLLKSAADKLTTIGAYEPQLTETALIAYANAFFLYQVAANTVNAAVSTWSSIVNVATGSDGQSVINSDGITVAGAQNKQQTMLQQFYGYWRTRTLFTVQTPWAVFQNMAIARVDAVQEAETRVITDFKVTFKMIRTASTLSDRGLSNIPQSLQGRAGTQASGEQNLGTSSPGPNSQSLDSGLTQMGVA